MDKAEAKKFLNKRMEDCDMELNPSLSKEVCVIFIDEYAQQVSREVAIDFSEWIDGLDWTKSLDNYSELFNEYVQQKSNQEDK